MTILHVLGCSPEDLPVAFAPPAGLDWCLMLGKYFLVAPTVVYKTSKSSDGVPIVEPRDHGLGVAGYLTREEADSVANDMIDHPELFGVLVTFLVHKIDAIEHPQANRYSTVLILDYSPDAPLLGTVVLGSIPDCSLEDHQRYCFGNPAFIAHCHNAGAEKVLIRKPDGSYCYCTCGGPGTTEQGD